MSTVTAVPIPPVKRSYLAWLWIGIVVAVIAAAALAWAAPYDKAAGFMAKNRRAPGVVQTASGLQYQVLKPGIGAATPTDSDVALINYEGSVVGGASFDHSQQPTPMPIAGAGALVSGLPEALKLIPKGAKYRFWLPPALGAGEKEQKDPSGKVVIPAHSVLQYDIEMLDWKSQAEIQALQQMYQQQRQQQLMQQRGAAPGAGAPPIGQ